MAKNKNIVWTAFAPFVLRWKSWWPCAVVHCLDIFDKVPAARDHHLVVMAQAFGMMVVRFEWPEQLGDILSRHLNSEQSSLDTVYNS